jgi:hypothetical protein
MYVNHNKNWYSLDKRETSRNKATLYNSDSTKQTKLLQQTAEFLQKQKQMSIIPRTVSQLQHVLLAYQIN